LLKEEVVKIGPERMKLESIATVQTESMATCHLCDDLHQATQTAFLFLLLLMVTLLLLWFIYLLSIKR